jgi:hypothetical protein
LWSDDCLRRNFLDCLPREDLANFRLACYDFGREGARVLFRNITVNFRSGVFTKPARMAALERIGPLVYTFNFNMKHTSETYLPPLLNNKGIEQVFHYEPLIHTPSPREQRPTYGSRDMTDMLTKQYGPLFHAATNIPAFIRTFKALSNTEHLKISCPGQEPRYRYRRSSVDYALISLRIAVERAPLKNLTTLSFNPIHPSGPFYLRSMPGIGTTPIAAKRWRQIKKLDVHMEGWDFESGPLDHLKHLHAFISTFSSSLERLCFRWKAPHKGPCPLSLDTEPMMLVQGSTKTRPSRIRFRKLKHMELKDCTMDAGQINTFTQRHRHTVRDFDFSGIELRSGTWDDAFAYLTR